MKGEFIMKTNMIHTNSIKTYISAIVLMLGMSISAWGAIYIEYDGNKYYNGTTITINVDLVSAWASSVDAMTIKNDGDGWSSSTYYRGYIHATISGSYVYSNIAFGMAGVEGNNGTPYWEDDEHYTSFYEWNNWQYETLSFYTSYAFDAAGTYNSTITVVQKDDNDASTLQSATITVSYVVTAACTPNDVVYDHSGTGGDDPTGDDAACEDATVTFTPDPSSGYAYSGATVYESSDLENAYATLDANTTSFTMPDEDVYVVATYAPIDYTISFNANGGTGSMESVERAYNSTYELPANGFTAPAGKVFKCWAEGSASGTERAVGYSHTVTGNITFYAKWRDGSYTDAKFSCADWTLTGPSGDIVFITSAASKTVRSQEAFHVSGNGLPHNTALTFTTFPLSSKFVIKKADGTVPQTDAYGVVDADIYVFYTPDAGDTSDGLDELTSLTVSVTGEPRTATIDTKRVIGRHLPADFVIAAKNTTTNKWYALPANMSGTGNPVPVEIAVDDINNPTIAYTAASNVYNLYLSADKEKVQLGMKNNVDGSSKSYALWANNAVSSTDIGKNTGLAENTLGNNYKWTLTQTNTSITNPQDAKYTISNLNNVNPLKSWFAAGGGPKWGLYASGVAELRLIPASSITFTEAYFVEWAQHGGVVEVDAEGVDATSVVAHLGEATSDAIELVQTKAGDAKNKSSKYNYTVNFGDDIDFADAESNGAMLTLEWKNGEAVRAMSNIVVPKIVASTKVIVNSTNYPTKSVWDTEVHVLPGDTLEIDASGYDKKVVTISELNIYPGATVKIVGTNDSLNVRSLVLRNGWTRVGTKRYDVARLYVDNTSYLKKANNKDQWYSDWYIDYDQYYPIAVPFPVDTTGICYKNSNSKARAGVRLRYYSGELRAANVQENQAANWVEYTWNIGGVSGTMPTHLEPSKGYIMTAKRPTGKAFSIIRMPLTFTNDWTALGEKGEVSGTHKDQVTVTAWGDENTPSYAKGWNIIANPYMAIYTGALSLTPVEGAATTVNYVNIPDIDFKEYSQLPTATTKLKPASAFLIQAPTTGTITFGTANRKASTPSFRVEENPESVPEQQAYIVLNNEQSEDMMGILVSDKYTAEYELNADLEKLLGDGTSLKTYMHYGDRNMAYVAINEVLAREWIPVTVRIPESGEYTYSLHEASIAGELEGIYLIDYQNGDHVTNLIDESYSFTAEAGTINGRFAINAIVGQRETPTDIDIINAGGDINGKEPIKFIWNDKVFILHRGVIYDSTGKRVREINR